MSNEVDFGCTDSNEKVKICLKIVQVLIYLLGLSYVVGVLWILVCNLINEGAASHGVTTFISEYKL